MYISYIFLKKTNLSLPRPLVVALIVCTSSPPQSLRHHAPVPKTFIHFPSNYTGRHDGAT